MRVATWNINSINVRKELVQAFLENYDVDVLLLQEIKCQSAKFPAEYFLDTLFTDGYESAVYGLDQWNGVAILSRFGIENTAHNFPGQPEFKGKTEARAIFATCGKIRVGSVYIPNGRALDDPHYAYKLEWLGALKEHMQREIQDNQAAGLHYLVGGDFNVIVQDDDIWDPNATGGLYLSAPERQAWLGLAESGMQEISRAGDPEYSFWNYQANSFAKNWGMRIDHLWADPQLAAKVRKIEVVKSERAKIKPSDHVPVLAEFDL